MTFLVAVVLFTSSALLYSNFYVKTVDYRFEEASVADEVRIVFLSDLHGRSFGKDNRRLLNAIRKAEPHLICLVGDFFDTTLSDEQIAAMYDFCRDCTEICDTYFSLGNHEVLFMEKYGEIREKLLACGVPLLEETYLDLTVNNQKLRLGGMSKYAFAMSGRSEEWFASDTYAFLKDFTSEKTIPTVLMCHRPECFFLNNSKHDWEISYLLCGHTHGGLWRLPFVGGLLAPEQLWFPEYYYGHYDYGNLQMLITAGFKGYQFVPRLFNPCEIAVLHLT